MPGTSYLVEIRCRRMTIGEGMSDRSRAVIVPAESYPSQLYQSIEAKQLGNKTYHGMYV